VPAFARSGDAKRRGELLEVELELLVEQSARF